MNHYILSYYPAIFNAVVRLTSCTDEQEADMLAQEILDDLRKNAQEFEADSRKGIFIYRLVLTHVFSHLKARGQEERIRQLQEILVIHPSHYLRDDKKNPPPGENEQGSVGGI